MRALSQSWDCKNPWWYYSCIAVVVQNRFVAEGRMDILAKAERIIYPGLDREGVMSPRRVLFFGKMHQITGQDCVGEWWIITRVGHACPVMAKDVFLRIKMRISQLWILMWESRVLLQSPTRRPQLRRSSLFPKKARKKRSRPQTLLRISQKFKREMQINFLGQDQNPEWGTSTRDYLKEEEVSAQVSTRFFRSSDLDSS